MSRGVRRGNSHSPLREIALELEPLLQRRARCIHVVEQRRHAAIDELAASALRALFRMTVSASEGCWCVTHCARNNNEPGNSDSFENVSGLGLGRDSQEQNIYCIVWIQFGRVAVLIERVNAKAKPGLALSCSSRIFLGSISRVLTLGITIGGGQWQSL